MDAQTDLNEYQRFMTDNPDVEAVDMLAPDLIGAARGKRLTRESAEALFGEGVRLPGSTCVLDVTGQNVPTLSIGGSDGDPDHICIAAPGTLVRVPWTQRPTAQAIVSMREMDGSPFFADPRVVLERAMAPLADIGLTAVVALELEFFLLDQTPDGQGRPRPAARPSTGEAATTINCYGLDELDAFDAFLTEVDEACRIQGVPAETATSEYAPAQFEINLKHIPDPLEACDHAIMLKRAIKAVAEKHGFLASFMAKPFAEWSGSGMHLHVSIVDKNGDNALAEPSDDDSGLSIGPRMRYAIGGLLESMPEAMAVFAPNANSYRRLIPGTYAPVRAQWGVNNRSVPLRIPISGDNALRIEHRVAGADANPYLVTAAVLAGIHHGLASKSDAPNRVTGWESQANGGALPLRWEAALDAFAAGKILPGYLGERYCQVFEANRRFECDQAHFKIPPLDYEWYLRTV